jgi:hypothetical protein
MKPKLMVENSIYSSTFLEIPSGFSENLTMHANGELNVTEAVNAYGVFNGGGGIFSGRVWHWLSSCQRSARTFGAHKRWLIIFIH